MAQLEREQIDLELESLQSQLKQLEIRSPIAGVIVEGDWVRSAGASVQRSQALYEIAPLEKMRVKTLLLTEDLAHIQAGANASLRVDSSRQCWQTSLGRIDPRGRIEDDQVVFDAESIVENLSGELRPGMRATTKISSGWKSLGWLIFNRPYTWVMKKLVW
jgi:multidrug efflux pump subunit AcrA (membrane-fusion protein)